MAGGWASDGAVQEQIDASVEDAVERARSKLPQGESAKTCRECGEPTCLVFATRVAEGVKGSGDCPPMNAEAKRSIDDYMTLFSVGSDGVPW